MAQWKPPDYAQPIGSTWKPPSFARLVEQAPLPQKSLWERAITPLTTLPSRAINPLAESLMQKGESGQGFLGQTLPLYGGAYLQSLGNVVSGLSSPLNLALTGAFGGANLATGAGLPGLSSALSTTGRALSIPVTASGAYHAYTGETIPEKLLGGIEMVGGGLGMRAPRSILPPSQVPPKAPQMPVQNLKLGVPEINQPRGLSSSEFGLPIQQVAPVWKPPSYAEPIAARTPEGVKIGADITSLGKILGSSLYAGDIGRIATKELIQNSFDAVKNLGKYGEIKVYLDRPGKFIEVSDNGSGLTLNEISTVFTDLGSSGKRADPTAAGGFGLAKAAPLLGGKKVEVTSIADEIIAQGVKRRVEYKFSGTPEELLSGVKIRSKYVGSDKPTGLTVRTYLPGEDIPFYNISSYVRELAENSVGLQGKIKFMDKAYEGWLDWLDDSKEFRSPSFRGANIETLETPASLIDIIIPEGTKYGESTGVPYKILNNGLYQGGGRVGWDKLAGIPENIIVNIRSKVPEGHPDYPFTANRESIRGVTLDNLGKFINDAIIKPSIGKRVGELKAIYETMPEMILPTGKKFYVYNTGNRFNPEELEIIKTSPDMIKLSTDISEITENAKLALQNIESLEISKLEKIGIIFEDSLYGIHIPAPGEGKSAILINPFTIIKDNTPEQASAGFLHTILHEVAHLPGGGHDQGFTTRLAEVYSKYGASNATAAQKRFFQSITKDGRSYTPELQTLLQRYQESQGRKSLGDDPLLGTGIKQKAPGTGKEQIPGGNQPDGTGIAVRKLIEVIKTARPIRQVQEQLYSTERGKRIAASKGVKEEGEAGFYKELGLMKGELPKTGFESVREKFEQIDIDNLFKAIRYSDKLNDFQKLHARTGLAKLFGEYGGEVPQRSELVLLEKVFGSELSQVIEMHGGLGVIPGNIREHIGQAINVPKAIMASMDFSAPLRQGLPLIAKKQYWKSFSNMFSLWKSEKAFQSLQQSLHQRPLYEFGERAGLKLTDIGQGLKNREEAFLSQWAEQIPLAGIGIRASERAYVGFLNKLRADVFDDLVKQALNLNLNILEEAPQIAKFVNNSTGRGSLGRLEKIGTELNWGFFSPRLITSRLTILNPSYYIKATPFVRKEALKALFSIVGVGLTVNSLAKLSGIKVGTEPTSSDLGKIIFGNTRLDPWGGFQQYIAAAMKLISGKSTSTISGRESKFGESYVAPTRLSVITQLGESKLSPIASFAVDMLRGKDFTGKPISPSAEVASLFTPIIIRDTIDLAKEDPNLLPLIIPAAFGMSVNTYERRVPKISPGRMLQIPR